MNLVFLFQENLFQIKYWLGISCVYVQKSKNLFPSLYK
jgi:hypothetical protein